MDFLHFIPKIGKPIRFIHRIGKNVDDRTSYRKLPGNGYKIYPFEVFSGKFLNQLVIRHSVSHMDAEQRLLQLFGLRYTLFQGFRITDNDKRLFGGMLDEFSNGGGTLDTQGRLVIAPFHPFPRFRKIEYAIAFQQII